MRATINPSVANMNERVRWVNSIASSRPVLIATGIEKRLPGLARSRRSATRLFCFEVIKFEARWLTLHARGRDIEERETACRFDKNTCRWTLLGEAEAVHSPGERAAIIEVLRLAESGEMHILEIMAATGRRDRNALDQLLFKMNRDGELIRVKRGVYGLTPGKMGKKEETRSMSLKGKRNCPILPILLAAGSDALNSARTHKLSLVRVACSMSAMPR
jgi:hypothetical protein